MIDIEKAEKAFKQYVSNYDNTDDRIKVKNRHTYQVASVAKDIATSLKLDEENIKLATLIGLLHDIGRFEQEKQYQSFVDEKTTDHAILGSEILFKDNMIRQFIEDEQYDNVIKKAIENHNKYEIESNLTEKELLHSKIIRDADKVDNFYVKTYQKFESLFNKQYIGDEDITESIYNTFLQEKCIMNHDRKTSMDSWISYIAFIFDLNFHRSFEIIKENDYISKLCQRIEYKNNETKRKMINVENKANQYIMKKLERD